MARVLASAAFRNDVLFVQYSSTQSLLGPLYAVYTNSQSPWAVSSSSETVANVVSAKSSKDKNSLLSLYFNRQDVPMMPDLSTNNPSTLSGVSMISTTSYDPNFKGGRHDLLIVLNGAGPLSSSGTSSSFVRLVPRFPNSGDGISRPNISPSSWLIVTEDADSVLAPMNSSQLWIASGAGQTSVTTGKPSAQEGAIVYRLSTTNGTDLSVQTIDISRKDITRRPASTWLGALPVPSVSSSVVPKVLRLTNSGMFDAVVIGQCAVTGRGTCLVFFNGITQMMTTTTAPEYDPNACLAAGTSSIIMVSPSQAWTFNYSPSSPIPPTGSWTARPIKGDAPGSILACAAKDSTVFTVLGGDPSTPSIKALDFGASLELSWQTMALIDVSSTNGPTSDPGQGIGNGRSRVSPATVAIIVVAALAVLVGAGWFWRRKSKSKMFSFQMNDATAVLPQSIAPAPSAARPVTTVVDGNTPSTFIPLQPINQTSQHVAVSISGSGPGPGPGPVGHRANSWSQGVPVSVDPIPVCVAYSNRTSLPYPVTSSTDGYHQALSMPTQQQQQQLPIIASSLSAAPYRSFVIPSSPIVTPSISSGRQPGDKEEFEQGQDRSLSHAEADSLPHLNPAVESSAGTSSIPGPSSSSSNALYSTTPGESFRSYRNSRPIQEMLSPTLANAQLILQQSQDHQRPR